MVGLVRVMHAGAVRVTAGQERTHLSQTGRGVPHTPDRPAVLAGLWDVATAQNQWRRWYLAHNIPLVNGRPPLPLAHIEVDGSRSNIAYVGKFLEAGIEPDICCAMRERAEPPGIPVAPALIPAKTPGARRHAGYRPHQISAGSGRSATGCTSTA